MLDKLVAYLHGSLAPFRLYSDPSPEPLPDVARPIPPGGILVDTRILLIGGRATIACLPHGAMVELPRLMNELHTAVVEGEPSDLGPELASLSGPLPPFGGLFGAPVLVDERVITAAIVCFDAFSSTDRVHVLCDDFARIERPRIESFAVGGELPMPEEEPARTEAA